MKRILSIIVVAIITSTIAFGQSNKEEIDLYQSIFGMEKKAIVADFLKLEKNDTFWTLYDEYETERKFFGQKRLEILNKFVDNYSSLTEEKTNELIKQIISQKASLDKLIVKYYKKINKSSGAKVAAQFYQIENFFLSATRMEVVSNLPFIVNVK
jgi:hypothetical protein